MTENENKKSIISGVVSPLSGAIASHQSFSFFLSTANANSCADPVYAKLFLIQNDGTIDESNPITSQLIEADARYTFDANALGLLKKDHVEYVVKAEGCNNNVYKRPITDFNNGQDIDAKTTIVSEVVNTTSLISTTLNNAKRVEVEDLINSLSGNSISQALISITTDTNSINKFTEIFGASPSVIQNGKPSVALVPSDSVINELVVSNFTAQGFHIDPNYSFAYSWKINGVVKSHASVLSYLPGPNESGMKTIDFYAGKDDGHGDIDLSKPYYTKSFTVLVNNSVLPIAPVFSLNAANPTPVTTNTITIDIATGVSLAHCETFSHMALTDSPTPPGIMLFNLDCTTDGAQTKSVTFTPGDGSKTLYLWAIDNEGQISAARTLSFVLDTLAPTANLTFTPTLFKGGTTQTVTLSASDAGAGLSTLALYYSATGNNPYTLISNLSLNATTYNWVTPTSNTTTAKLKLRAVDLAGRTTDIITSAFEIDSLPPSAPTFTRTSSAISSSTTVTATIGSCTDTTSILINESATPPAAGASGWTSCSTLASNYSYTVSGQGLHTIYAWAKDSVDNIATIANPITMTYDSVLPTIAITNLTALKGNTSTGSLTWTVTEANVAASTTFNIEIYNGSIWSNLSTLSANAGNNNNQSYTLTNFSVPNINTDTAKIRITLIDAAGNSRTVQSNDFIIDSTAPTISSTIINDGATYAGTAIVGIKVNTADNYSIGNQIKIRFSLSNTSTDSCQTEYADNNWASWTNATTDLPFTFSPSDGVKKVCAWAKDQAGNVSVISPALGTNGVNYDSITYSAGNVPQITAFSAVRTSDSGRTATIGQPLTITWTATDIEGLDNNPISISYTTDNTTWNDITTNLTVETRSNMTWFGSLSGNPTGGSGTVTTFTAPSDSYFRIRAQVKDVAGNTSLLAVSEPFNTGSWNVYAGTKHRGDGGTGRAATFISVGLYNQFAINPKNGDIYVTDSGVGIRKLDAKTGIVSTFIKSGTINLSATGGSITSTTMLPANSYINLTFDNKGKLYIGAINGSIYLTSIIYQVDVENMTYKKYAGGGTQNDGGGLVLPTDLSIFAGGYNFDEENSLYAWTLCNNGDPVVTTNYATFGHRIVKITQNTNGTAGTVTRVIGDCTYGTISSGTAAANQPAIPTGSNPAFSSIIPWNNGNTILVLPSSTAGRYKILNGVTYPSNGSITSGFAKYNPVDGYVYKMTSSGAEKVLINTSGANGDVATPYFTSNSSDPGCTLDGVTPTTYCAVKYNFQIHSGVPYFSDGSISNGDSVSSIRYFDSNNKLRTIFGSPPFYGDGLNKSLMRGNFSGIYYKKASENNQTAFPEGLYFVEPTGVVFGYIDPTTGVANLLWGNQSRLGATPIDGKVISKDFSMGHTYTVNAKPLNFDSDGLPWLRTNNDVVSIDANKKIVRHTNQTLGSGYMQNAPDGADPSKYGLMVSVGIHNFAIKNKGLFIIPAYVTTAVDPTVTMRYMDFDTLFAPIILGGTFLASENKAASPDLLTPGTVATAPLWTTCKTNVCYMQYNEHNDRLYFSEGTAMRYITTPDVTATATLRTLFTIPSSTILNFKFNPNGSQLWYFKGNGGLYCYDISSGKSWCDNSTDHFAIRTAAGLSIAFGPDQMTFKDNQTMFVSTYSGEILQFTLPTGP